MVIWCRDRHHLQLLSHFKATNYLLSKLFSVYCNEVSYAQNILNSPLLFYLIPVAGWFL